MSFGRIKRTAHGGAYGKRTMTVHVEIYRSGISRYGATACIRGADTRRTPTRRLSMYSRKCGHGQLARTPQSAIAKALKSLSGRVARRGKRRS